MALDTTVMNTAIATVAEVLGTTVTGIQTAITLYTLVMASLMITGGKIGEILGRKRRGCCSLPRALAAGTAYRLARGPHRSGARGRADRIVESIPRQLRALDQQQHRFSYADHQAMQCVEDQLAIPWPTKSGTDAFLKRLQTPRE